MYSDYILTFIVWCLFELFISHHLYSCFILFFTSNIKKILQCEYKEEERKEREGLMVCLDHEEMVCLTDCSNSDIYNLPDEARAG